jgi:4'-phosphopantetheinyl transferase
MPQAFFKKFHFSGTLLLWRVEEELDWFKVKLNLAPDLWVEYDSLENEVIRHRWLASRYAVQQVSQQSPLKFIKETSGKPILLESENHISLSHCEGYVAAIHADLPVGIDVERISHRAQKIKNYFLRDEELGLLGEENEALILAWSAKESIFKWYGKKNLGYKSQLCIRSIDFEKQEIEMELITSEHNLIKPVFFRLDQEKVLTWVAGDLKSG